MTTALTMYYLCDKVRHSKNRVQELSFFSLSLSINLVYYAAKDTDSVTADLFELYCWCSQPVQNAADEFPNERSVEVK